MPLVSRAFETLLKLPPARTRDVAVHRDMEVAGPDGTPLRPDLYLAHPDGKRPAVLLRTPYGRRGVIGSGLAARVFAERGYHAVVQSTRGTHGSGGAIDFDREAGYRRDTADPIYEEPRADGELGAL